MEWCVQTPNQEGMRGTLLSLGWIGWTHWLRFSIVKTEPPHPLPRADDSHVSSLHAAEMQRLCRSCTLGR